MKKKMFALFFGVATAFLVAATPMAASAADVAPKVSVNDELVVFPDEQPYVDENGRTMIPVRFVAEALGADVEWDPATRTAIISKDGTTVEITIGQKNLKVTKDGKTSTVAMDTAAVNKDGRTSVPIRFVAEALGAYVDYSNLYKMAEIVMPEEVTAAEIERLRDYDLVQWWTVADEEEQAWLDSIQEYDYFTGDSGFSNSHFYLISYPKVTTEAIRNIYTKTKAPAGTSAYNYALFAMDYARDEFETREYPLDPTDPNSIMLPGQWSMKTSRADIEVNFRTDMSLVYQMVCPPQACISVRGVMEIKANAPTDLKWFAEEYGIENPQYGKVYSVDVEQVIVRDKYDCADSVITYRFDEAGNPVEIE